METIPPEILLEGYSIGIFPMSESRDDESAKWYTAERRGIIPLSNFRISSNTERLIRNNRYDITIDQHFRDVIRQCANRPSTWISDMLIESYCQLHDRGHAHSVEVFNNDSELVGGLYGVSLGAAFFGESMFNHERETSKVALYYCHKALQEGGFELWDTQFYTEHLAQFGCIEISAREYDRKLQNALKKEAVFTLSADS